MHMDWRDNHPLKDRQQEALLCDGQATQVVPTMLALTAWGKQQQQTVRFPELCYLQRQNAMKTYGGL